MPSTDDSAFKVAALIFTVISSLIGLFGVIRFTVGGVTSDVATLQQKVATLEAKIKPTEYYETMNRRMTVNEIKIEACLLGD